MHAVLIVFTCLTPCAANGIFSDAVDIFNLQHQLTSIAKFSKLAGFDQIHNLAVVLTKLGARFIDCVENFCHNNVGGL